MCLEAELCGKEELRKWWWRIESLMRRYLCTLPRKGPTLRNVSQVPCKLLFLTFWRSEIRNSLIVRNHTASDFPRWIWECCPTLCPCERTQPCYEEHLWTQWVTRIYAWASSCQRATYLWRLHPVGPASQGTAWWTRRGHPFRSTRGSWSPSSPTHLALSPIGYGGSSQFKLC